MSNHQLLMELGTIIVIFFILLIILLKKPQQKRKTTAEKANPPLQKQAETNPPEKTFSNVLKEQKKKPPLPPSVPIRPPVRPVVKKAEPAPLHDLSEEEERALQEAMMVAGKQALAEVTGEPHQTEIFQSSQASDAAKKIFAGQKRSDIKANKAETQKQAKISSAAEFVMIYYMAPRANAFEGEQVFTLLRDLGLKLNEQHVFEYNAQGLQFYVSSAVKPGHFDIHRLHYRIPGIAFVLDILAVDDPEASFNEMLKCIHQFSQILRGDILDENRQRLTQSNIHQYTARIESVLASRLEAN